MKAKIVPLYFESEQDADFVQQLDALRTLLADEAEILSPAALGSPLPEVDAVVFPQMLGNAYRRKEEIKAIRLPALVITSEFGTVSMWDWEINRYLRGEGVCVIAPYNLEQARIVCRALAARRTLRQARFLVFQDNPGEGFQASIFKRFYWWEEECTQRMKAKFGVEVVKKSFKELGARAMKLPDAQAQAVWEAWKSRLLVEGVSQAALNNALKMYLALKREVEQEAAIIGVGINCLNESHFSNTAPCLAWNMLYEESQLIWGCEADSAAMLTKYWLHKALAAPVMMTNLYPFLMGQAALKHEHIPNFPVVAEAEEDHLLLAHCGYLGVVPQSFATQWTLREKVLAIVDENATAIDARLPEGKITLVKLDPTFGKLSVVEGILEGYAQFPGSHCVNGAVIRVADGRRLMDELYSHHYILVVGHHLANLRNVARIFELEIEAI